MNLKSECRTDIGSLKRGLGRNGPSGSCNRKGEIQLHYFDKYEKTLKRKENVAFSWEIIVLGHFVDIKSGILLQMLYSNSNQMFQENVFAVLVSICQSRTSFRVLAKMKLVIGCYFPKCSIYQMLKAFVSFGKNGEIWQKLCSIKSPSDSKPMQLHAQQNEPKLWKKYNQICYKYAANMLQM